MRGDVLFLKSPEFEGLMAEGGGLTIDHTAIRRWTPAAIATAPSVRRSATVDKEAVGIVALGERDQASSDKSFPKIS